jgi:phosphoribosyl-ATP pyrophosphohydrolase
MFKTLKYLIDQIKRNKKKSIKISYTASLLKGKNNISLKKFLEESKELFNASHYNNKKEIIHEAADLLYHFLVLLEFKKISVNSVLRELEKRKKISGIKEKNNRKYNVR